MNRSNQFDVEAYGEPRRKTGCSPFMLLMMFGLIAFVFFQFRGANERRRQQQPDSHRPAGADRQMPGNRGDARLDESLPRADQDDWSIEEVETSQRTKASNGLLNENLPEAGDPADTSSDPGQRASAGRTDRGDWSIEEVDSKRPDPAKPKSTKKGDWEIEEVAE